MDLNMYANDPAIMSEVAVLVAEATPSAIIAPVPNWLSKISRPSDYQGSVEYIRNHRDDINYTERGAQGMPVLRIDISLEHRTVPEEVDLAGWACYQLDQVARVAGAWGPDCVIEKFTKLPKHGLPKLERTDDYHGHDLYIYTPIGASTEEAWFILGNGAGRQCEVIVTFHPGFSDPGEGDCDASDVIDPDTQRTSTLIANAATAFLGFSDLPTPSWPTTPFKDNWQRWMDIRGRQWLGL